MPKLLYLSCHSIAEFLEIQLLKELGFEVFSHGSYTDPRHPGDPKRPPLDWKTHQWFMDDVARNVDKNNLNEWFLQKFDVIFSHWMPDWIANNWEKMHGKTVILRTNGQSIKETEQLIAKYKNRGLKVVRYSPLERLIPDYCGEDAMIRFFLDENEYSNWNGSEPRIMNMTQSMIKRERFCNYRIFEESTCGLPRVLYGPQNEEADFWGGCLSHEKQKQELRDNRVYFYTGTYPACYTLNFIEAFMTGIPVVAVSEKYGNADFLQHKTYEVADFIENNFSGLVGNTPEELRNYCEILLNDRGLAERIGQHGRQKAIEIFGREKIKKQWKEFFKKEGVL